jgi:2-polyprenyl-3-methyl-5-hydroxy-6-metoxy-1,4-benzoquinol methylase
MKRAEFRTYQETTMARFRQILAHGKGYDQGLPSYTNPNPFMHWLIWKRVEVVLSAIVSLAPLKNALDFGCGYGVFLPYLIANTDNTIAYDLMIDELKALGQASGWQRITYESDFSKLSSMKQSFDLILAIEVLEHIDELGETIRMFYETLKDNGNLLVAGPSENFLYRIGRKLVGYSGDYHVRNIYDIRTMLTEKFHVHNLATIVPGLPFFEIYRCAKYPISGDYLSQ